MRVCVHCVCMHVCVSKYVCVYVNVCVTVCVCVHVNACMCGSVGVSGGGEIAPESGMDDILSASSVNTGSNGTTAPASSTVSHGSDQSSEHRYGKPHSSCFLPATSQENFPDDTGAPWCSAQS